jgi:YD repeat-containing protein
LAGASDASGNPLSIVLISGPTDGTLTSFPGDGSFVYAPTAGFVGTDSFVFEAYDGTYYSAPTTATINVTDNPAQIQASASAILENQDYTGTLATFTVGDSPANTLTATIDFGDGQTATGTIVADPSGGYDVEAPHAYTAAGTYNATVTITDPLGVSASASLTITVLTQYDYTYTDPDGNETQYIFTGNWQMTQEISPLGGSTYYTYTSQGQVAIWRARNWSPPPLTPMRAAKSRPSPTPTSMATLSTPSATSSTPAAWSHPPAPRSAARAITPTMPTASCLAKAPIPTATTPTAIAI